MADTKIPMMRRVMIVEIEFSEVFAPEHPDCDSNGLYTTKAIDEHLGSCLRALDGQILLFDPKINVLMLDNRGPRIYDGSE